MTVFDGEEEKVSTSNPLDDLVGEGKKFATVEDMAKGKVESDRFIEQLQSEMAGIREDLDKRLTSEQVLEEINRRATRSEVDTTPPARAEDVSELVKRELSGLRAKEETEKNIEVSNQKMISTYGTEKAIQILTDKAREMGVTPDFLKSVAAKSPQAFYSLIGIDSKASAAPAPIGTGSNTEALHNANGAANQNAWTGYEQMRKDNPKEYWSATNQRKMFEAKKAGII
jgi:cell division ATPase FtsA